MVRLHNELAEVANAEARHIATHADLWRTVYAAGANEKFIPFLQTMPAFHELPAAAAAASEGSEYDAAVEEASRMMDASEIAEFKRNLSWALEEVRRALTPPARSAWLVYVEQCGRTQGGRLHGGIQCLWCPLCTRLSAGFAMHGAQGCIGEEV